MLNLQLSRMFAIDGVIDSFFLFDDGTTTVWVNFASHGKKALLPKYAALKLVK
jgi:hypothetical protein